MDSELKMNNQPDASEQTGNPFLTGMFYQSEPVDATDVASQALFRLFEDGQLDPKAHLVFSCDPDYLLNGQPLASDLPAITWPLFEEETLQNCFEQLRNLGCDGVVASCAPLRQSMADSQEFGEVELKQANVNACRCAYGCGAQFVLAEVQATSDTGEHNENSLLHQVTWLEEAGCQAYLVKAQVPAQLLEAADTIRLATARPLIGDLAADASWFVTHLPQALQLMEAGITSFVVHTDGQPTSMESIQQIQERLGVRVVVELEAQTVEQAAEKQLEALVDLIDKHQIQLMRLPENLTARKAAALTASFL